MRKFEIVSKYDKFDVVLPTRATSDSAGYDLCSAVDIIIPSLTQKLNRAEKSTFSPYFPHEITLGQTQELVKEFKLKPTLVPTGIKVALNPGEYLSLSARSSLPLKHLLLVANAPGIIDADYYNNPDNEGEIFIQLVNLSPFNILIKKGDKIAQGIIAPYFLTDDDYSSEKRIGGFGSTPNIIVQPYFKPLFVITSSTDFAEEKEK